MIRQIKRNILKKKVGSNRIRLAWRKLQIKKYGEDFWLWLYRKCVGDLDKKEMYLQ